MSRLVRAAFVPLLDAAPLIVAREFGFADGEGIDLQVEPTPSWSAVRDLLVLGRVEAAHLLAPIPVALALGLGGGTGELDAIQILNVNGNTVTVSRGLADAMRGAGHAGDVLDAQGAGRALAAAAGTRPIRLAVPFPFSMHAELLCYWLERVGASLDGQIAVQTIPPPMMADALAVGEIDAFCVGEPWGSMAVESGAGEIALATRAVWAFAPEKVLAARSGWSEAHPASAAGLARALYRAGRWLSEPTNWSAASEILAQPGHVGATPETIERALSGRLVTSPAGSLQTVSRFIEFHAGAATFPWRSQGAWIGDRLARRHQLDPAAGQAAGRRVFRSDLYRRHLAGLVPDMPGAS